ncbi:hypothetical protein FIV09_18235 [Roseivivax sp. THAF197b]|nr:hypothetical protein FIV09_18235 [Roseivivax sp. THAF197b]
MQRVTSTLQSLANAQHGNCCSMKPDPSPELSDFSDTYNRFEEETDERAALAQVDQTSEQPGVDVSKIVEARCESDAIDEPKKEKLNLEEGKIPNSKEIALLDILRSEKAEGRIEDAQPLFRRDKSYSINSGLGIFRFYQSAVKGTKHLEKQNKFNNIERGAAVNNVRVQGVSEQSPVDYGRTSSEMARNNLGGVQPLKANIATERNQENFESKHSYSSEHLEECDFICGRELSHNSNDLQNDEYHNELKVSQETESNVLGVLNKSFRGEDYGKGAYINFTSPFQEIRISDQNYYGNDILPEHSIPFGSINKATSVPETDDTIVTTKIPEFNEPDSLRLLQLSDRFSQKDNSKPQQKKIQAIFGTEKSEPTPLHCTDFHKQKSVFLVEPDFPVSDSGRGPGLQPRRTIFGNRITPSERILLTNVLRTSIINNEELK